MRRIRRPACGSVGAAQGGTGSCFLRDPLAHACHAGRPPVEEEVDVGRKMILLLGWLTRGVQFVRRLARCGCVRRVMAAERARFVSGCARAGGDVGLASWATRLKGQARLGWATAAPSSFLSLLFLLLRFKFS